MIFCKLTSEFKNLSIQKKGFVLFIFPTALLLLFSILYISLLGSYETAQKRAEYSKIILNSIRTFEGRLYVSIISFRSWIFSGQENNYFQYQESWKAVRQSYDTFRKLTEDNPLQRDRLIRLDEGLKGFERVLSQAAHDLRGQEKVPTTDSIVRYLTNLPIDENLKEIGNEFDLFSQEELRIAEKRRHALDRSGKTGIWAAIIGSVLTVIVTGLLWALFSHTILSQIKLFERDLADYSEGKELQEGVYYKDEIGNCGKAFALVVQQLREKEREVDTFVYSTSHDLRSPLVNLEGFSRELEISFKAFQEALPRINCLEQMRSEVSTLLEREVTPSLGFIRSAVSRLSSIIDGLLKLSRLGKVEVKFEEIALTPLITELIDAYRVKDHDAFKIDVTLHPLPVIVSDKRSLQHIFGNLISNAFKYMQKENLHGQIEIGTTPFPEKSSGVTLYVKDNGVGIPAAYHSKVFKAFERLHPTLASGEGMGLVFVRKVVHTLGGKIWFESDHEKGSTFFVYLPAKDLLITSKEKQMI